LLVKRADFATLKRADVRLVTSTSHNASEIHAALGRRAAVVPYGCGQLTDDRADALLARGPGPRSSTVLYIGGLDPRKNVATLIEAFRSGRGLLPDDAELLIVGKPRGPGSEKILRAVEDGRRLGVRHLPFVSTEEALELIDRAGALVLPSADEGFGLPLLEALASGTPAVGADIPAIRAWAKGSLTYARPGDAGELATALATALNQSEADRTAGQQFASQFRWHRFAGDLLKIADETRR
jgi:glycosyltransferase involved in cell wall biosynthesis